MKFLALFALPIAAFGATIRAEPHTYPIDYVKQLKGGDPVEFQAGFTFRSSGKDNKLTTHVGGCEISILASSTGVQELRLTHNVHWTLQGDPVPNKEEGTIKLTLYHSITSRTITAVCDEGSLLESLNAKGITVPTTRSYEVKIEEMSAPASESVERPADATIAI